MNSFECIKCKEIFKTKQQLERHIDKKKKCDIITKFKCNNCSKYLGSSYNLQYHIDNNTCKEYAKPLIKPIEQVQENNDIKIAIKSISLNNLSIKNKIILLSKYNMKLTNDELKIILLSNTDIDGRVSYIYSMINNNEIDNNITNNIKINNFGKEDISYLNDEYFKNLILKNDVNKIYMKLAQDIYFDKDHPENKTIKIDNINNKYALVFNNGKWETILKYELREILHEKNHHLLRIHTNRLKELLDSAKKSSINVFLSRQCHIDPHLEYMIDKIILLFYNGKELYAV
jgi:hypothetical protein